MRLLFIANDFPNPYQPTKGLFNLALTTALQQRHQVRIISPVPWVDELSARRRGVARFDRHAIINELDVRYPRYLYPPKILRGHYGWFYRHSIRRSLNATLKDFSPDAVIGYWAHPDGEAAVRIAQSLGVPSAVIIGGSDVLLLTRQPARARKVAAVLRSADAVVTVNAHLRQRTIDLGARPDRAHVWTQGVNGELFYPGDQSAARLRLGMESAGRVLLWVGRMVPVKGLDVLLSAARALRDRGVSFTLHLVGDGPLAGGLRQAVAADGMADVVKFAGPLQPEQLADWYRAADLTVLSSRSEGLPNVLRESLACGTPFVATDVGGIRELCKPGWSSLVPPGDSAALADAIACMLSSPRPVGVPIAQTWIQSADALVRILFPLSPSVSPILPGSSAPMSLVQ